MLVEALPIVSYVITPSIIQTVATVALQHVGMSRFIITIIIAFL